MLVASSAVVFVFSSMPFNAYIHETRILLTRTYCIHGPPVSRFHSLDGCRGGRARGRRWRGPWSKAAHEVYSYYSYYIVSEHAPSDSGRTGPRRRRNHGAQPYANLRNARKNDLGRSPANTALSCSGPKRTNTRIARVH